MLRKLRWQLSLLYVLSAGMLILLIGLSVYGLLNYYFRSSTDLALQYKVAQELTRLGLAIPQDLKAVDQTWKTRQNQPKPTPIPARREEDEESSEAEGSIISRGDEDSYDSELAPIYVLTLNPNGQVIVNPNAFTASVVPDSQAVTAALAKGNDFRTLRLADGSRRRIYTYRVMGGNGVAILQVGRSLKDQDRVLKQFLLGLAVLSSLSVLVVGIGSWWLAGRSLIPAQQAWDRQQTFVANASHELRTPLTLLRASAEVAQRSLDPGNPGSELLDDIINETDHMSRLVDDLLLLSRLDAGRLKLDRQPIQAASFLEDLGREASRVASDHGVKLEVLHPQGVALADPTRLRQVYLILFDNAIRHTPPGGTVRFSAFLDGSRVLFEVNDTGSGIPAEQLPHIFERFYRGNEDRRQFGEGNGLGLAIAKGLVEAMHGQITITSQPGRGTSVTIRLPGSAPA